MLDTQGAFLPNIPFKLRQPVFSVPRFARLGGCDVAALVFTTRRDGGSRAALDTTSTPYWHRGNIPTHSAYTWVVFRYLITRAYWISG
ncbi:MAG: hypothetical protein ACFFCW_43460 [Candidatus Hodarchaeota archaeon]